MTTNSSPIIFESYSSPSQRSSSFHHHQARVHPQPSFYSQRNVPSTTSSPICRHAQIINNHQNGHFFYNQLKSHHQTHSQNASVANSSSGSSPRLVERCVIVAKELDGYGLTVAGEQPVFVDSIKKDGAAAKAGVRERDQILKINGMPVSSSNHFEVLRMISSGKNVALTLLGEPLSCDTCRPIFFESGFFEEPKSKKSTNGTNKSPNEHEATDTDELETEDKVEPVRQWVNSGDAAAASTITSSTRDLTRAVDSDEDDEHVDDQIEEGGGQRNAGFVNAVQLKRNPADLALFLNFAIHHSDPTSSLFYLITDAYQASNASLKESRRFAYEIFSTFLIPNAPLEVPGITQIQIQAIDRILAATANSNFHDQDQLKKVFVSARSRALGSMEDVYAEFGHQRTHGTVKAINIDADPATRLRIAEQILFKLLEELFHLADNDLDKCDARTLALILSIATVLRVLLNLKTNNNHWEKLLDKCPTFVTPSSKTAGVFKMKPIMSKKSIIVKDHQFTLNPVYLTVLCYQCSHAVWGVNPQAYFCQNCDVIVHKQCTGRLIDRCYPATQHKNKGAASTTTQRHQARLRTTSALNLSQPLTAPSTTPNTIHAQHTSRQPIPSNYRNQVGDYRNSTAIPSSSVAPVHRKPHSNLPSDSRSMGYDPTANSRHIFAHMESVLSPSDLPTNLPPPIPSTSTVNVEPPPIPTSQMSVQQQVIQRIVGIHHGVEGPKSTSSDSGIGEMERPVSRSQSMKTKDRLLGQLEEVSEQPGLESDAESCLTAPSTYTFATTHPHAARALDIRSVSGSSSQSINQEEARHMIDRVDALCEDDSDLEADVDIPPLDQIISWQILKRIDPKMRKLQESINEFYHTERTHVRNLKVICRIFLKPIMEQKLASREFVRLVFGNLDELLEIHSGMFQKMKLVCEQWKKDSEYDGLYGRMGGIIATFFNGEDGERFQKATAAYCQDQQQGLRMLSERRSKDEQLAAFLTKAESNPLCRKFQLKDLLPVEMQRIAKYPLLLDSILRYTLESSDEFEQYTKASMGAKRQLSAVNTAKRDTENRRYLEELNRKIEMPTGNRPSDVYIRKYFDIMQYRYVYDGDVVWRHSRGKADMRLVLLDHLLILLTKGADGKYYMRSQEMNNTVPLLWLPSVTIEEKVGDKRMFVIFYERDLRTYELQAQSITEKKTWEQLLKSQISAAKHDLPHHNEEDLVGLMSRRPRPHATQPSTDEAPSPVKPTATATASVCIEPMERLVHVSMHPGLVRANEIVIQQPTILEHARPVLSPSERLTRSDKIIMQALAEKHEIIAAQLMSQKKINQEEMESMAELLTGMSTIELRNRNPAELALSAIVHVNRLVDSINTRMNNKRQDSDRVGEEAERYLPYVPCYKLTAIAAPLLNHLTALSQVVKEQRDELNTLRKEINKNKLETAASSGPDRSVSEETLTETRMNR